MAAFNAIFPGEPNRDTTFTVRGVCEYDSKNPCWDNRPSDVIGKHWGGGTACGSCVNEAKEGN